MPVATDIGVRRFGTTDLTVSEFGLGCARIGGIFQRDASGFLDLLAAAYDAGITFFDSADIYSQGESERLLGRVFRHRRDRVVIASKAGYVLPAQRRLIASVKPLVRPLIRALGLRRRHLPSAVRGELAQDFSPSHLRGALEGSLRRLATDHLDLLQLHSPPAAIVSGGQWVETLERLKQEGKIRYYGISCDTVEAATAALAFRGLSLLQVPVNLLDQQFVDLLPRARERGIAVIARECLANGLLVKEPEAIDALTYTRSVEEAAVKTSRLEVCRRSAAANGCTLAELALRFVVGLDGVSTALIGASRLQQLEGLLADIRRSRGRQPLRDVPRWP